jgi:hypothetical protein
METLLGILGLAVYVIGILLLSAAITFLVVKISPAQSAKKKSEQQAE